MIHLLLGLASALALSALAEAHPLVAAPRPLGWGFVFLGSLSVSALVWQAARRSSLLRPLLGLVGLLIFLGSYYAILWPLGWAHWVLFQLGWRGEQFASILFLLFPGAVLALWLSPSFYLFQRGQLSFLYSNVRFLDWLKPSARVVLLVVSIFLLSVWAALCLEAVPWLEEALNLYPSFGIAITLGGILFLFSLYPFLFLLARETSPIPPGDLLDSLQRVSRSVALNPKAIRVWKGTPLSINACALGVLPGTRRVFFTSGMCEHLEPDGVAAVLSHEAGHLARGHIGLHFLLIVAFLFSMGPFHQVSQSIFPWLREGMLASWTLLYWGIFFGHVARWLEVEADIFGAGVVGFPAFTATLEKVAALVGSASSHGGWRHFSLKRRLCILSEAWTKPEVKEHLMQKCRFFRRAVYLLLTVCLIGFAWSAWREASRPGDELALESAESAMVAAEELRPLLYERDEESRRSPLTAHLLQWLCRDRQKIAASYRGHLLQARSRIEKAISGPEASSSSRGDGLKLMDAAQRRLDELDSRTAEAPGAR